MKKLLIISLSCIGSLSAMEQSFKFKQSSIRAPQSLGSIELVRNEHGFHVVHDDECYEVKNYFVDPLLRNASKKALKKFQKAGYVEVKKLDNEDFVLHAKVRGLGGGPATGAFLYWLTKTLCYGTAVAAVGVSVAATGGAVVAGGAAIAGGAGATIAGASVTAVGAGVSSALGGTAVGAAVTATPVLVVASGISATASGAAAATGLTGGALAASGGCVATMVAGVETLSMGAFALGLSIPFLP